MLGVALLERCGTGFDALDVAKLWLDYLPAGRIFTAERVALRNLLEAYLPPETATRRNPFREWIGARLRVDAYGWAAAGDPVAAARMAWEDARLSHTANGIYAAMFMAAAHAASLSESSAAACADTGLSVVPRRSRLAVALRAVRDLAGELEWEALVDRIFAEFDYHHVHAINNTALVAARALCLRRRLLRRDLGGGSGRARHGHERRRRRLDPGRPRRPGRDRGALVGAAARPLLHLAARLRRHHAGRARPAHGRGRRVAGRGVTIPLEKPRDPLVPRPIDLPTVVPLEDGADLEPLDAAKIFVAPDDPADWPAWRAALTRWRAEAAARIGYDGAAYDAPEYAWTRRCHVVALAWLWDELLYDHETSRFTPERFCADAEREFGGLDGIVLWHAYPVIGIDDRNQFDFYREVPGIRELVADLQGRGLRVFVNYNPWDVGTRREPLPDDLAIAELVRELRVDGVFLDTMKEAQPGLRAALDRVRPGIALEGESTLPLARTADHHLSWAQWFSDSEVPGVLRARWFEQRHMLHHTRRWNRDHTEELHSAWLNGVGILVWENVFGAWVGWSERDKALLRAMRPVQREHADLLATGEWTPLAAASPDARVVASRWSDGETTVWALANRGGNYAGPVGGLTAEIPAGGIAAFLGFDQILAAGGGDASFPARDAVRVPAPIARVDAVPDGFAAVEPRPLTAIFRRRETGTYGEAPYVEEWKPLPPRLHDFVEVERPGPRGRYAIAVREVADETGAPLTGLDLAAARAYAEASGARLPTEDEWQRAAEDGLLERLEPLVWNWTESEHTDGRTRFAILKGGCAWRAEGSDWYVDSGPQEPAYSLKLLLRGGGLAGSPQIGFRLAVDLA